MPGHDAEGGHRRHRQHHPQQTRQGSPGHQCQDDDQGRQVDPGPLHQGSDDVVVELLDGGEDPHRPQRLGEGAVEEGDDGRQRPTHERAHEGDQVEKPGGQADQQPEGEVEEVEGHAGEDPHDQRHQQLAPHERTEGGHHLAGDIGHLLPVLGRSQFDRPLLELGRVHQHVEGEHRSEQGDGDRLGDSPQDAPRPRAEPAQ